MTTSELKETAKRFVEAGELPAKDWIMSLSWAELAMYTAFVEKSKEKAEKLKIQTQHEKLVNDCIETGEELHLQTPHRLTWILSSHALRRFIERAPKSYSDPICCLEKDLDNPIPAKFTSKRKHGFALCRHNFEEATYWFGKVTGMLYVMVGNRVKTCHRNEAKYWKRDV